MFGRPLCRDLLEGKAEEGPERCSLREINTPLWLFLEEHYGFTSLSLLVQLYQFRYLLPPKHLRRPVTPSLSLSLSSVGGHSISSFNAAAL